MVSCSEDVSIKTMGPMSMLIPRADGCIVSLPCVVSLAHWADPFQAPPSSASSMHAQQVTGLNPKHKHYGLHMQPLYNPDSNNCDEFNLSPFMESPLVPRHGLSEVSLLHEERHVPC